MVKIRLKRMGAHKKPFYRIVVADSRNARNGKFIEEIGYYDPLKEPPVIKIDGERAQYWLDEGAQPTDVVRGILKKEGILDKDAFLKARPNLVPAKKKETKEDQVESAPAEAAEEAPAEEVVEEVAEEAVETTEEAAEAGEEA